MYSTYEFSRLKRFAEKEKDLLINCNRRREIRRGKLVAAIEISRVAFNYRAGASGKGLKRKRQNEDRAEGRGDDVSLVGRELFTHNYACTG